MGIKRRKVIISTPYPSVKAVAEEFGVSKKRMREIVDRTARKSMDKKGSHIRSRK